jgi:hypothetical protein
VGGELGSSVRSGCPIPLMILIGHKYIL